MVGMFLFKQKCTIPSVLPSAVCSMNGICCRAGFSRPYVVWNISLQIVLLRLSSAPPLLLNQDSILDELTNPVEV